MKLLALAQLALVTAHVVTGQRINFDGARPGACKSSKLDVEPKQDFIPAASEIQRILDAQPKGPFRRRRGSTSSLRNPEGYQVTNANAKPGSPEITFGARERTLRRLTKNAFADGLDLPRGACHKDPACPLPKANRLENGEFIGSNLPNPRAISALVSTSTGVVPSRRNLGDITVHFGQFLSHDTTLVPEDASPDAVLDIAIPAGDPVFDRDATGQEFMQFRRAIREKRCSGAEPRGTLLPDAAAPVPRDHNNEISSFIDGTMIYGGTTGRQAALREKNRRRPGQLKVSSGNLLPLNNLGTGVDLDQDNPRGVMAGEQYFGGDVRTNEAPGLTTLITVFFREHNRLARHHIRFLRRRRKRVSSDAVFAWAKKIVIAELQKIAYEEWLPALFGEPFPDFDPTSTPSGIADLYHEFSAATRRFGHTMVNGFLPLIGAQGNLAGVTRADLSEHLFNTISLINRRTGGIGPLLRGILCVRAQQMDTVVTPGLQQRLFAAEPGHQERDLVALNIMRGREHGVADYNSVREALKLKKLTRFNEINPGDRELTRRLASIYRNQIDRVDLFIGMLAEAPAQVESTPSGTTQRGFAEFGETLRAMFKLQFSNIRQADRFFHRRILSARSIAAVPSLSDILKFNLQASRTYPPSVFPEFHSIFFSPLFCRAVLNFQCVPRGVRLQNPACDNLYGDLPDLANSTSPSMASTSFPWLLRR